MDSTSTNSSNHNHQTVKRKSPSGTATTAERPPKQMRSTPDTSAAASLAPQQQNVNGNSAHDDDEDAMDVVPSLARIPTTAETAEWQATIESVVKNVVAIHFCQPCSFDTDSAMTSEATGFVVDAERGYILTNRHVVGSGPFWGHCIFDNHEEVRSTLDL
jgi:S1-C subfamily serine protease